MLNNALNLVIKNTSNTNVVPWGDSLLTLFEVRRHVVFVLRCVIMWCVSLGSSSLPKRNRFCLICGSPSVIPRVRSDLDRAFTLSSFYFLLMQLDLGIAVQPVATL